MRLLRTRKIIGSIHYEAPVAELVVVGAGRAGLSFAIALSKTRRVALVCRDAQRSASIERMALPVSLHREASSELSEAEVVIFATPDRALRAASEQWVAAGAARSGQSWIHLSGLAPPSVLAVETLEVSVASCHPLAAIADPLTLVQHPDWFERSTQALEGAFFAIDGDNPQVAIDIAKAVGGRPRRLDAKGRGAYHAAASIVANDWVALMAVGQGLAQQSGLSSREARQALLHLSKTAWDAVASLPQDTGLSEGLTGPVGRGDADTVRAHLALMEGLDASIHRALSIRLLEDLERSGRLGTESVSALREALIDEVDDSFRQ